MYASWKDLVNAVIKGYTSGVLEAWTLPVLYLVGKHLRVFAIKADESVGASGEGALVGTGVGVEGGLQEDIAEGRNGKLEDAARVMMRMFTLCISDRYVGPNPNALHHQPILSSLHFPSSPTFPYSAPLHSNSR